MESNHNPHYEKLDLDPFTFSSPNSAGWNDLELKNLLEDKKQKAIIEKKIPENPSPLQKDILVELSLNEVEAFAQLSQEKNPDNINNAAPQQDWKQSLPQPKPKIDQTTLRKNPPKITDKYLLQKMHALPNRKTQNNPSSLKQKKIVQQDSISSNNHSSVPIQKNAKTTKQSKERLRNLVSLLAIEAQKSFPTVRTNHSTDEPLVHLIHQLNKKTIEKLQNRLNNKI